MSPYYKVFGMLRLVGVCNVRPSGAGRSHRSLVLFWTSPLPKVLRPMMVALIRPAGRRQHFAGRSVSFVRQDASLRFR